MTAEMLRGLTMIGASVMVLVLSSAFWLIYEGFDGRDAEGRHERNWFVVTVGILFLIAIISAVCVIIMNVMQWVEG